YFDLWPLDLGLWSLVVVGLSSRRMKTKDQRSKTKDQRSKIKDQRPKTKDQRPKTKDQRPKTKDQRPKTPPFGHPFSSPVRWPVILSSRLESEFPNDRF